MMVQSSPTIPTSPRQTVPQSPDNAIEVPTSLPTVATEDLEEYDDDGDSAFGSAKSDATDTPSMTSSILKYREEYGRTYHAFGEHQLGASSSMLSSQARLIIGDQMKRTLKNNRT
ncbi:hypothetical protein WAI453_000652 [Rhynchosporium graminicola]